jgi:ATP/maltotriose-dependent transcriptional regulator MalT
LSDDAGGCLRAPRTWTHRGLAREPRARGDASRGEPGVVPPTGKYVGDLPGAHRPRGSSTLRERCGPGKGYLPEVFVDLPGSRGCGRHRPLAPVPRIRNTHAGRRSEFEHALEESLAVFEDLGDSRGVAEVLLEQGRVAHAQGNDTRAASLCRESLAFSSKLDNKSHIAFCLTVLAGVIQATGDAARAAPLRSSRDATRVPRRRAGSRRHPRIRRQPRRHTRPNEPTRIREGMARGKKDDPRTNHHRSHEQQFVRISTSAGQHFSRSASHACRASKSRLAKA